MAASVVVEEKTPLEFTKISENKLKYTNKAFVKKYADIYNTKGDLKIMVGKAAKTPFVGHKVVLKGVHDYFGEMFYHHGKDGTETYFKEITANGFSAVFEYFYHGCITMEPKLFPDILEAASFFKVEWVLDACRHFMIHFLSVADYLVTVELANKYGFGDVRGEICKEFGTFLSKFASGETSFKDCSKDLLLDFLKENVYTESSEYSVLQYVLKWVNVDKKKRNADLMPLLREIRFHIMTLDELENVPGEILDMPDMRKEVEDAKLYCSNVSRQCLKDGIKYLSRGSKEVVVVSAFNDESDRTESNMLGYKDPSKDEVTLFVEELGPSGLTADYSTMNQATIGNFLFAAGGYDKNCTSCARVFMYDTRTKKWTEVASMAQARASFAMCSSKNRLYAIGGVYQTTDEEQILSSVEMYAPAENAWQPITSLVTGCSNQAAVYCNNALYVSGGIHDVEPISSVVCLQDKSPEWTSLPDMSVCRQGHNMTVIGGKIYVLGGYTSKPSSPGLVADCSVNEIFDLETKQWTSITSTPKEYGHLYRHTGLVQNKIYFLCNMDTNVYLNSFDTEYNEFNTGVLVGRGAHKVSILQVSYSRYVFFTDISFS